MKRLLLGLLLAVTALAAPQAITAAPQEVQAMAATQPVGEDFTGIWKYDKPFVDADGTSIMGKIGKPIAKNKLKSKLNKAFKKLKIKERWQELEFDEGGQWRIKILGQSLKGSYTFNPDNESLTLRWRGVPLVKAHYRVNKDRLYLSFDADRLLVFLHFVSGFSDNETLKAISTLSENFNNVMLGFELKRQ